MAAALAAAGACGSAESVSVRHADVTVSARPDGAIILRENLTVQFTGTADHFERRIPLERAESLSFESAFLDGKMLEPGLQAEQTVDVDERGDLSVTWRFRLEANASHAFELTYRANGAVAVRGTRGVIRQVAVPPDRAYGIESATVRFAVDAGMHLFDGAGLAEAGWAVSRTNDGIMAERRDLAPADGATVMAEVAIDTARIAEPVWQRHEEWGRDLIPAFVSGGLFILVIGGGVLWIVRFQYPKRRRADAETDARERAAVRSGLRTSGRVAVVLSGGLAVVTWLTLSHFGWWPMSLPVSILIVGVVFLAIAKRYV